MLGTPTPDDPPWYPKWANGDWRMDCYANGKRLRRRFGLRDEKAEELARTLAKAEYDKAWARILNKNPTFSEAALLYMKNGGETRFLAPIIRYFGPNIRIDEIDQAAILRAQAKIAGDRRAILGRTWKSNTARRQISSPIKAVLSFMKGTRRQPSEDDTRKYVLTPEQFERLISAADNPEALGIDDPDRRLKKAIAFMMGTGCTTGETFAVDADDFNHATSEVLIRAVEPGAGKTPARQRWVYLPQKAVDLIGELPSSGRAFLQPNGQPYLLRDHGGGQMSKPFRKFCRAACLPDETVCHTLRHTWATFFSSQVQDHDQLLDRGGWSNSKTARRYRKLAPADLAQRLLDHGWDFRMTFGRYRKTTKE